MIVSIPHVTLTRNLVAGLSASLLVLASGATATAAPINVPWSPDGSLDSEVEFVSNGSTLYGSVRTPIGEPRGAALLIPGSGPTDRNGNQAGGVTPNTLAYIADALAERGIATLRFDKVGSGRTGATGIDPSDPPGFVDGIDAAGAALELLSERTGFTGDDLAILGHSEGTLTALSLKERGADFGPIGLLEPAALRFLDILSLQLNGNYDRAVAAGQLSPDAADRDRARLAETIDALRSGQPLPYPDDPTLSALGVNELNAKYLTEVDAVDSREIAATLPSSTKVLLTCSEKDLNVSCDQIDGLHDSLTGTDVEYARLINASHQLSELGPLPATQFDIYVPLPQSSEFRGVLDAWADSAFS